MTTEPRAALDRLVAALEAHLDAAATRRGEEDPAVVAAYQRLAEAFEVYDEALYENFDEATPFVLFDDEADALDEDDADDDELDDDELDALDDDLEVDDELELRDEDAARQKG